ncbi:MAG: hypothetical protein FJZ63_06160 [Chlamydiae bacterium]|nr:hypothetical protein [Chlamydiota bacterium]
MNTLPFVAIVLILLAGFSYRALGTAKISQKETSVLLSYLHTEKKLLNALHTSAYKKLAKAKKKTPSINKSSSKSPKHTPRKNPLSPMNLTPLFEPSCPEIVSSLFVKLLKLYYEQYSTQADLKKFAIDFTLHGKQTLQEFAQKKVPFADIKLSKLYPHSPVSRQLFYKMLKGTHLYDLQRKEGYPPFEEAFCLKEKSFSKLLHFPSLSPGMLRSIFGEEIAASILDKEASLSTQEGRSSATLSEHELLNHLHEHFPTMKNLETLIPLLDFSLGKKRKEKMVVQDMTTYIQIEKELPKI